MKRVRRILLWTGLALAAILACIVAFLFGGPGERVLRRGLELGLSKSTQGPAAIASFKTDFWSYVEVQGVTSNALQASKIRSEFQLFSFLGPRPRIRLLRLDNLVWTLPDSPSSKSGKPAHPSSPRAPWTRGLTLDRVQLGDSTLVLRGQSLSVSGEGSGIFIDSHEQKAEQLQFQLEGSGLRLSGSSSPPLDISAVLEGRGLSSLEPASSEGRLEFDILQGSSRLSARAHLSGGNIEGKLHADISRLENLAAFWGEKGLSGSLRVTALATGSLRNPTLEGKLDAKSLRVRGFPLDVLVASLQARGGDYRLTSLVARGSIPDLGAMEPPFRVEKLGGKLNYELRASGSPSHPEGNLEIRLLQPTLGDLRFDRGLIRLALKNQDLSLEALSLVGLCEISGKGRASTSGSEAELDLEVATGPEPSHPHGSLKIQGRRDSSGAFHLVSKLEKMDLGGFRPALPKTLNLEGMVNLELAAWGQPEDPSFKGSLSVADFGFQLYPGLMPLKNLKLEAVVENRVITLKTLEALSGPNPLRAFGRIRFQKDQGIQIEGELSGPRTGSLSVSGRLGSESKEILISADHLNPATFEPLALIAGRLGGTLDAKIKISGQAGGTVCVGYLDAAEMEGFAWVPGLQFRKGSGRVEFKGSVTELIHLSADLNGGRFTLGGTLDRVPGAWLCDLAADLHGTRLPIPPWGEVRLDACRFQITRNERDAPLLLEALMEKGRKSEWVYRGREFQLLKFLVRFPSGDRAQPRIELEGFCEPKPPRGQGRGRVHVRARLEGPWNSATLALQSDPALGPDELETRVFGQEKGVPGDDPGPKTGVK